MHKKISSNYTKDKESRKEGACSLCGQLYQNFAFKGGYICEDCLGSIKVQEASPQMYEKNK